MCHLSSFSALLLQFITEARSPIYSQLSLTLQGLSTIRSYSMQSVMIERLYQYQNQHTQAWYLFIVSSRYIMCHYSLKYLLLRGSYFVLTDQLLYMLCCRWFALRLDLLGFLFITGALLSGVALSKSKKY